MTPIARKPDIPGTTLFDAEVARKGYALNKMCYSFNSAENREAFLRDEDAYCARFGLSDAQRSAVRNRNVLELIAAGGNDGPREPGRAQGARRRGVSCVASSW